VTRERLPDRRAAKGFDVLPDYDPSQDMCRSIEFAYACIRARVARGGRAWRGWPENSAGLAGTTFGGSNESEALS
jgi:hypothetical protein